MTDNVLIAIFMGFYDVQSGTYKVEFPFKTGFLREYELKFDTSWDWLMPVVEKIEKSGGIYVDMSGKTCTIGQIRDDLKLEAWAMTKLEATYIVVVEFIKWYNTQKD